MRAKSFILLIVILAAAGASIGAGLNYALHDPEPEAAAQNNDFTFQLPAGFGQGGQLPPGLSGSGAAPTPSEPDDNNGATAPDNDGDGDDDDAQRPGRPQTPLGGLGGLVRGSVVDVDSSALTLNTDAGSATFALTDETLVSLQRPAAESGDVLVAGASAFIAATFDDRRALDAMMIVIGGLGANGGPLPPGSAFANFALLDGKIESVGGGVIVLKREQDTFEIRYADDVTVSTQMSVDEALEHITPGVEVGVGAQPGEDGALTAALIMVGDLDGFGLGGGFLRGAAGGIARPRAP